MASGKKTMSKSKGLLIMLTLLGLFFITFLYAGISNGEIWPILISVFFAFIWLLMLSSYIQGRKFKKSLNQHKKEKSNTTESPKVAATSEPVITKSIPAFSWEIYDNNKMPKLSIKAHSLWKAVLDRIRIMGADITKGLFILMILNWTLLIIVSVLYGEDQISFFNHIKFSGISAITTLILVVANIRSAFAQGIPLLLSVIWLAHPIVKGLGWIISKSNEMTTHAILVLIVGGILIVALWALLTRQRLQKYQELAKDMPSAKLLFLWVFRTQSAMEMLTNFGYKWKILGPVFFLNGAGMMTIDNLKLASKVFSGKKLMVENETDLAQQIKEFSYEPDKYGAYKVQSVLCGDGIWKQTLDHFIEIKDVVLMSLCGYTEKNKGCEFEIRKLIDNIPTEKIVFFINERTDMIELEKDFKEFWCKMSHSSPNLIENPHPIVVYNMSTRFMDELEEQERLTGEKPSTNERFKRLKSLAQDGDDIIKLLCQAITINT